MKIFLSWSGPLSKQIALALREWLPNVIQAIDPWMSAEDIEKGSRWSSLLAKELATTKAGIVCLTPDNSHSPWLNFESGALSKAVEETMVCPYLLHLKPSDLKGPLTQFQMSEANKEDTRKMIATLNGGSEKPLAEKKLLEAVEMWWPKLEARLIAIPSTVPPENTRRTTDDMLEEVLGIVRDQSRTYQDIFSIVQQMQWKDVAIQNSIYPKLAGLAGLYGLQPENPTQSVRMSSDGRLSLRTAAPDASDEEPGDEQDDWPANKDF
jgi:hypothetical protein